MPSNGVKSTTVTGWTGNPFRLSQNLVQKCITKMRDSLIGVFRNGNSLDLLQYDCSQILIFQPSDPRGSRKVRFQVFLGKNCQLKSLQVSCTIFIEDYPFRIHAPVVEKDNDSDPNMLERWKSKMCHPKSHWRRAKSHKFTAIFPSEIYPPWNNLEKKYGIIKLHPMYLIAFRNEISFQDICGFLGCWIAFFGVHDIYMLTIYMYMYIVLFINMPKILFLPSS